MKAVTLYTDGACSGNPGPGGWAAILQWRGKEKVLTGGEKLTTNNRMELMAPIAALEALKRPCAVEVYSDSQYVVNAFNKRWIDGWQARGWNGADKKPVKNIDLWQRLLVAAAPHEVRWLWVKGHADDERNARCDALAVAESRKYQEITPES